MKSMLRNILISVRTGYGSPWIDEGGCSRGTLHHSILLWRGWLYLGTVALPTCLLSILTDVGFLRPEAYSKASRPHLTFTFTQHGLPVYTNQKVSLERHIFSPEGEAAPAFK